MLPLHHTYINCADRRIRICRTKTSLKISKLISLLGFELKERSRCHKTQLALTEGFEPSRRNIMLSGSLANCCFQPTQPCQHILSNCLFFRNSSQIRMPVSVSNTKSTSATDLPSSDARRLDRKTGSYFPFLILTFAHSSVSGQQCAENLPFLLPRRQRVFLRPKLSNRSGLSGRIADLAARETARAYILSVVSPRRIELLFQVQKTCALSVRRRGHIW